MNAPTHLADPPPALHHRQAAFRQADVTRAAPAAGLTARLELRRAA